MQVRLNENHREVAQRQLARMAQSGDGAETRGWLSRFAATAGDLTSRASNAAWTVVAKPVEPQQECC
jgi:hypothetical protein